MSCATYLPHTGCLMLAVLGMPLRAQGPQVQIRSYHSQAQLSHAESYVPVAWQGTYLQGGAANTQEYRGKSQSIMKSYGQELTLGIPLGRHWLWEVGLSQAIYFPEPGTRIEDVSPKTGWQLLMNIQDRWIPFVRLGLSRHDLKLISNRLEYRQSPLDRSALDLFAVEKQWTEDPKLWNGDVGGGCKFMLYPTTALAMEYRYSVSLQELSIREREVGTSSYKDQSGYQSEGELVRTSLLTQEYSLALQIDL